MEEAEKMEKEQWGKFNKLELFSKLTKSLYELYKFCEELNDNKKAILEDNKKGYDALYYLLNEDNKGILDKCFYAVQSYKHQYKKYEEFEVNKYKDGSYRTYTGEFLLINKNKKNYLSGEVLNSTNGIIKSYIDDINNVNSSKKINKQYWAKLLIAYFKHLHMSKDEINEFIKNITKTYFKKGCNEANSMPEKDIEVYVNWFEKFSCLAKMFFHLVTTVGNVMPWPNAFNPSTGSDLDIFQKKFPMLLGLYEWIKLVGNEPTGDETEEEKEKREKCEKREREEWIRIYVNNHYLQDFVNDEMTEALNFYDQSITNPKIKWNLYFCRASKAIMKRSYRILRKENIKEGKLSVDQANELDKAFIKFCKECGVEEELIELKTYLVEHKEKDLKDNEIGELEELINKLGEYPKETAN